MQADLDVGGAGFAASKTFVVDYDMHRLDGADLGIENVGDSHRIEESRSLLAPLMIEES
jgi:hypothetical protein